MDKPELDTTKVVAAAMNMREAAKNIVQLERDNTTSADHLQTINVLEEIIDKQQTMIAFTIEHYIRLAELLDMIYAKLDSVIDENKEN